MGDSRYPKFCFSVPTHAMPQYSSSHLAPTLWKISTPLHGIYNVHECRYRTMLKDDYKMYIANVDGNLMREAWRNTILNATSNTGDPLRFNPDINICFNENQVCRYSKSYNFF